MALACRRPPGREHGRGWTVPGNLGPKPVSDLGYRLRAPRWIPNSGRVDIEIVPLRASPEVIAALADLLVGTVTLHLDCPPNQPHRGEIAKLMTRVAWRGRGIGRALMLEAERIASERGRTLLTLDTGTDDGAGALYEKLGFTPAGVIPDYAFKPFGGLQGTIIYWKRIGPRG